MILLFNLMINQIIKIIYYLWGNNKISSNFNLIITICHFKKCNKMDNNQIYNKSIRSGICKTKHFNKKIKLERKFKILTFNLWINMTIKDRICIKFNQVTKNKINQLIYIDRIFLLVIFNLSIIRMITSTRIDSRNSLNKWKICRWHIKNNNTCRCKCKCSKCKWTLTSVILICTFICSNSRWIIKFISIKYLRYPKHRISRMDLFQNIQTSILMMYLKYPR